MEIIINFKGSNFTIHCCESETIQTIKIKIMQEKNIPILKQDLSKDSIQLVDIETLSNYKIWDYFISEKKGKNIICKNFNRKNNKFDIIMIQLKI